MNWNTILQDPNDSLLDHLKDFFETMVHPMGILGVVGQALFCSRFLVQWLASEKKGRSTVPNSFWYFSLIGGSLTLVYAIWREDPVFTVGQLVGLFVYVRNLMLIHRQKKKEANAVAELE